MSEIEAREVEVVRSEVECLQASSCPLWVAGLSGFGVVIERIFRNYMQPTEPH